MARNTANKTDVYTSITNNIISDLERGVKPWSKPWDSNATPGGVSLPKRSTGEAYQGINVLTLWDSAIRQGFSAPRWLTFKQALTLGGCVRKGEKGSPVVHASTFTPRDDKDDKERKIPFLKRYTVFNVEQVDDLPAEYYEVGAIVDDIQRNEKAEQFFSNTGADIRHGGDNAYYKIISDYIRVPLIHAFKDTDSYYSTVAHEMTHWTRHRSRLDRDLGRVKFGDEGYAKEELVAELGAAFICADLGLKLEDRADHSAYIGAWLTVLRNDKRAIFRAAAHAQKAVNYLHSLQTE